MENPEAKCGERRGSLEARGFQTSQGRGWVRWKIVSSSNGVKDCVRQDRERIWIIRNHETTIQKCREPPSRAPPCFSTRPSCLPTPPLRLPSAYVLVHPPLHIVSFSRQSETLPYEVWTTRHATSGTLEVCQAAGVSRGSISGGVCAGFSGSPSPRVCLWCSPLQGWTICRSDFHLAGPLSPIGTRNGPGGAVCIQARLTGGRLCAGARESWTRDASCVAMRLPRFLSTRSCPK
jgi:hypothetical protein